MGSNLGTTPYTTMKNIYVLFIIILLSSCNSKKEFNSTSIQLNNEAMEKIKTEDYTSALNLLNESIKLDSTYYIAYNNKIGIVVRMRRYDEAITTSKLLLLHKPDLAESHFFLGMLYDIKEDTIQARQSYENAIRIFNNRIAKGEMIAENEINLAGAYIMINEEEKGNKLLEKYLSDKKYGIPSEILYKKKRDQILNQIFKD